MTPHLVWFKKRLILATYLELEPFFNMFREENIAEWVNYLIGWLLKDHYKFDLAEGASYGYPGNN